MLISENEYYRHTLSVRANARCQNTEITAKAQDKGRGIGSNCVYLNPTPKQVRELRKALQTREAELVRAGFLEAEI